MTKSGRINAEVKEGIKRKEKKGRDYGGTHNIKAYEATVFYMVFVCFFL